MTTPNEISSENKNGALEEDNTSTPATNDAAGDEFQLTIKKLEMPVRPRGVLAD
jgi:hypothetical protein